MPDATTRVHKEIMVVRDALADDRFKDSALVQGWQFVTLDDITRRGLPKLLHDIGGEMEQLELLGGAASAPSRVAEEEDDDNNDSRQPPVVAFPRLVELAKKAEKKLAVLRDVALHEGMQLPLADPLVSAVLLDSDGTLTPFLRRCTASMNEHGLASVTPDERGAIVWLMSDGEASRRDLVDRVHRILFRALER